MRRRRIKREVDLDSLPMLRDTKHPDRLLELDDETIIVIEETRRPEPDDLHKLLSLPETLKEDWTPITATGSGSGKGRGTGTGRPKSLICIVHHTRSDTLFYTILRSKSLRAKFRRYGAEISAVKCAKELRNKLSIK